jgi:hypothetical protein
MDEYVEAPFAVGLEQPVSADSDPRQDQCRLDQVKDEELMRLCAQRLGCSKDVISFTFQNLSQMARGGIIVYLLCSYKRCDAVAITSEGTALHIPLPDATPDFASQMARTAKLSNDRYRSQFGQALSENRAFKFVAPEIDHGRSDQQSTLQTALAALWRLIAKPIIDGLGPKVIISMFAKTMSDTMVAEC